MTRHPRANRALGASLLDLVIAKTRHGAARTSCAACSSRLRVVAGVHGADGCREADAKARARRSQSRPASPPERPAQEEAGQASASASCAPFIERSRCARLPRYRGCRRAPRCGPSCRSTTRRGRATTFYPGASRYAGRGQGGSRAGWRTGGLQAAISARVDSISRQLGCSTQRKLLAASAGTQNEHGHRESRWCCES